MLPGNVRVNKVSVVFAVSHVKLQHDDVVSCIIANSTGKKCTNNAWKDKETKNVDGGPKYTKELPYPLF